MYLAQYDKYSDKRFNCVVPVKLSEYSYKSFICAGQRYNMECFSAIQTVVQIVRIFTTIKKSAPIYIIYYVVCTTSEISCVVTLF